MAAARSLIVLFAVALAVGAPSATAHSVPVAWWLDEPTAVKRLEALERERRVQFDRFTGTCEGLAPSRRLSGRVVYKHFACWSRIRALGVNFSFKYRVHVSGPRGKIALGG